MSVLKKQIKLLTETLEGRMIELIDKRANEIENKAKGTDHGWASQLGSDLKNIQDGIKVLKKLEDDD